MSKPRLTGLILALLAAPLLHAGDYDAVISAMKKVWPSRTSIAVVCDATASRGALNELTAAAGGMRVLVVDVKGPQDVGKAIGTLSQHHPSALVLIAGDHVAGDGSAAAGFLIQRMAAEKIPTVATTQAGVKQGAAIGIGPGTGGKLFSNARVAAVAGVSLPPDATPL
ncbi:MAG: hypothetical protein KGI56_01135 [Acidobacteriota bacterium]|nr:hypothetical protein [Acidobacteriota bacterium]